MNYDITLASDCQVANLTIPNTKIRHRLCVEKVTKNNSLSSAVQAYRDCLGEDPYRIGVSFLSDYKKILMSIHSKNGTGYVKINCSPLGPIDVIDIVKSVILEYITGEKNTGLDCEFDGYCDALYTELVYGKGDMYTEINDSKILYTGFALFSIPFSPRKYKKAQELLGYDPIVEFSVIDGKGVEMDALTYKKTLDKIKNYGYFVMKGHTFLDKIKILRARFVAGTITIITTKTEFIRQKATRDMEVFLKMDVKFLQL